MTEHICGELRKIAANDIFGKYRENSNGQLQRKTPKRNRN